MSSISAVATTQNNPNYLGQVFKIGEDRTPFLTMIGGLQGANPVNSWNYALNSNYELNTASQSTQSEDDAIAGATATTYARAQDENSCELKLYKMSVSYANESDYSTLAGVPAWAGPNFNTDKLTEQVTAHTEQLALDMDFALINGVYVKKTASSVVSKTRGILTACTTNKIDASGGALTKTNFNAIIKTMADNNAKLNNGKIVIHVNSSKKQELTALFGLQERSNSVGGVNVEVIATDFGNLNVVYNPTIPQDSVLIADMSVCSLRILPVMGQAVILEQLGKVGASTDYQLYCQYGMDYGIESRHGLLTNLA